MEWHLNDLSMNGQFSTSEMLRASLEPLLRLRDKHSSLKSSLFISREVGLLPVSGEKPLHKAISEITDSNFKTVALRWLSSGPFWSDNRSANDDDYFEFNGEDVTNQGLGEAIRRHITGIDAHAYSFQGSGKNCEITPLSVQHGIEGDVYGTYDVANIWTITALEDSINSSKKTPTTWDEFLLTVQSDFQDTLIIPDYSCDSFKITPFSMNVVRRSSELLNVLSELVKERDASGSWTARGRELYNNHFTGPKAWFTDESEQNRIDFKNEMSFVDPDDTKNKIFCPWHGKIKTPQSRIHFEWPIPVGKKLKVLYMGPKITKK